MAHIGGMMYPDRAYDILAALLRLEEAGHTAINVSSLSVPLVAKYKTSSINPMLSKLTADGLVSRTGKGHKGDPYLYSLTEAGFEALKAGPHK